MSCELVFVSESLYCSHYAMDSVENCLGSAEPEDLGSSCGPISAICFFLSLTGLFWQQCALQGTKPEGSLLLPGNLIAYTINFLVFDSFFSTQSFLNCQFICILPEEDTFLQAVERIICKYCGFGQLPGMLAQTSLLRWAFLGLQSSPKGILRAVVTKGKGQQLEIYKCLPSMDF